MAPPGPAAELPGKYFHLMEAAIGAIEQPLTSDPLPSLKSLETRPGWRHFPSALLVAAVLYARQHPANPRYGDARMLSLALRIGDLLARENEQGNFTARLDHHRDTYMWLEAYRLLERELGEPRRMRWRRQIESNVAELAQATAQRQDRPAYQSPFLGTSPNHFSLWASTVYLAGRVFGNKEWERLGGRVMHRFAVEELSPDGYWGEHSSAGPTTGYNYLTAAGLALYWEHSHDPAALEALRRATDFHKYFTYPNGQPVELLDDRRRHVYVSPWAHYGFSNFPDGRRYAEFLTSFYRPGELRLEHLGRVAQNALYYHEGPLAPIPQDGTSYKHRLNVPAAIRKSGPWVVCLSGLISTQALTSQYYLDRQGHLSIFHERLGLIVTGANSKRQPELATFWEKVQGQVLHLPLSSRLRMSDASDRLALAYQSFFSILEVPAPSVNRLALRFTIARRGGSGEAQLNLQLCLKAGEALETGAGRRLVLGGDEISLGPQELAGWLRHSGWTLHFDSRARLTWPVYPYNPYADGPEKEIEHAVGLLSFPLRSRREAESEGRNGVQEIAFTLEADNGGRQAARPARREK